MSNFFEMGSSHIQPAWESNNNNKKVEEGRGLGTAAPVRGGAGPRGWDGCRLREPGVDTARGGGRAPRPLLPLPVWPSTWLGPPGEGWGDLSPAFKESSQRSRERLCLGRAVLRLHPAGVVPCVL